MTCAAQKALDQRQVDKEKGIVDSLPASEALAMRLNAEFGCVHVYKTEKVYWNLLPPILVFPWGKKRKLINVHAKPVQVKDGSWVVQLMVGDGSMKIWEAHGSKDMYYTLSLTGRSETAHFSYRALFDFIVLGLESYIKNYSETNEYNWV